MALTKLMLIQIYNCILDMVHQRIMRQGRIQPRLVVSYIEANNVDLFLHMGKTHAARMGNLQRAFKRLKTSGTLKTVFGL